MDTNVNNKGQTLPDPRIEMLATGITRGNNNIISLLVAKMPTHLPFNFKIIFNGIPEEEFNKAHGCLGSWATDPYCGGADVCFNFFKQNEFIEPVESSHRLTEPGRLLKQLQDYNNYVNFVTSEKKWDSIYRKEGFRMAQRQVGLSEKQGILAYRQFWLNMCIMASTAVAAIYYLAEICHKNFAHHAIEIATFLCVFLFGIVGGLIIYQIVRHLSEKKE